MQTRLLIFVLVSGLICSFSLANPTYAKNVSPTPAELAKLDSDKDGYSDLCETLHESDVNDAESVPSENITINVPSDTGSIQQAINLAIDGDTILVAEGKYQGNIHFNGKSITLTSDSANTIIEGTEDGSVITIDTNSTISGFIITSKDVDCRGVYVINSSPIIENCIITGNQTSQSGAGIYSTENSNPKIIETIIIDNSEEEQVAGSMLNITDSYIELADNPDSDTIVKQLPQYVPGEVIVKLKETEEPDTLFNQRYFERKIKHENTLSRLKAAHRLRNEKPVFKSLHEQLKAENSTQNELRRQDEAKALKKQSRIFKPKKKIDLLPIYILKTDEDVLTTCSQLSKEPEVEYAQPNYLAYTYYTPSDSLYSQQWAHQKIQSEDAWDIERGNPDITIAIVDTGVDYEHEDLADNIWRDQEGNPGKDFVDIDTSDYTGGSGAWTLAIIPEEDYIEIDNDPSDYRGHGTHCAGIAGAVEGNGAGIVGTAHKCKIMPARAGFAMKVYFYGEYYGITGILECDDIAKAIRYAADNCAQVINMSFGGDTSSPITKDAIDYAYYEKGVILVAAAGNDNTDAKSYPAAYENVISVCATAEDDTKASFSNFGDWIDIAAPGTSILSTLPNNQYSLKNGTSMASPHVAGACALLLSRNPTLTSPEIKNILLNTVDIPNPPLTCCASGGRLNLYNALNATTPQSIWYVDDDSPGGDGTSWDNAFRYLQDALCDTNLLYGDEIRVAHGIYKPDRGSAINPGNRRATFQLVDGVSLKGGYAGLDCEELYATSPNARDIAKYQTILSGDLNGNDGNPPDFANYGDNSLHVVTGIGTNQTAILDGFIITGGNAVGGYDASFGGGLCNTYNGTGNPTVANCIFSYNRADYGGAICITSPEEISIINCVFDNNFSRNLGGAILGGLIKVTNCVFTNNTANFWGEHGYGGAIAGDGEITNCTFYGNTAITNGRDIYSNNATITNCILWNNGGSGIYEDPYSPSNTVVSYSNVEGGYDTGEGNIDIDPLFLNPDNPAGDDGIFLTWDDGLQLGLFSPCIDKANDTVVPTIDILRKVRCDIAGVGNDGGIGADIGAYEFNDTWNVLGEFNGPSSIHYDSTTGYVYIADYDNDRIVKTRMNSTERTVYGSSGTGTGQFRHPAGIYYDNIEGYIYVADCGNHRIVKMQVNDTSITKWATYGTWGRCGRGEFYLPHGIHYDNGYIYVADSGNNRIVKMKVNSTSITEWITLGRYDINTDRFSFKYPMDIYYDSTSGYVYVADSYNHRIVETQLRDDRQPEWIAYGSRGSGVEEFSCPTGIYHDSNTGYTYVADNLNHRIVKTKIVECGPGGCPTPDWTIYGSSGPGLGEFSNPLSISYYYNSVSESEYIYIADYDNNRIVRVKPTWE